MEMNKNLVAILIVIVSVAILIGLGFCFKYISSENLSSAENVLISILLTILSALLSWIITHIYARNENSQKISDIKNDYSKNLQTYARKASEKVDNLSNELSKLSLFLKDELENEEDSLDHDIFAKKSRIESAIHIIGTLKSINDKSLSDWQGVIPEDLEERDENQREETEALLDVISKFNKLDKSEKSPDQKAIADLSSLERKLDYLIFSKTGTYTLNKNPKMLKTRVSSTCPNCMTELKYKQRPMDSSIKSFICPSCGVKLISRWDETNESFYINTDGQLSLVNEKKAKSTIDESLIGKVKEMLPAQPWPKGTHKIIREKLNISNYKFNKIIETLVERGFVKKQVEGKLIEKV